MSCVRVWVDLANSPHVPLLEPLVRDLRARGADVLLTARDHAQTVELARHRWDDVLVVGGESPPGVLAKGRAVARRATALARTARRWRPDVAFSHGSYAQVVAARACRVPAVTMMDYEHQPANHLSFRFARLVIVPEVFPERALRRFGAAPRKVVQYQGFKEDLYLSEVRPDARVLDELGLDPERVIAVFRPPPDGALYHRMTNEHFSPVLWSAVDAEAVQVVLLPRSRAQRGRYQALSEKIRIPVRAVDGLSLLSFADVTIGAGGTMNRESALLGTPTYTVFVGKLAAVDAELMRLGLLHDLRIPGEQPKLEKKPAKERRASGARAEAILDTVLTAMRWAADPRRSRGAPDSP